MLNVETGVPALDLCQRLSMVSLRIVQDRDHRATQVPQQIAKEYADLLVPDVIEVKLVEKVQVLALRADGDSRDDRDLLTAVAMPMDGSLAAWCPGLDHVRNQQESGFVGKDDVGAQPRSVFFIRGHCFCFQRSICSSLRSMARFSGFWWLQFKLCIKRPM